VKKRGGTVGMAKRGKSGNLARGAHQISHKKNFKKNILVGLTGSFSGRTRIGPAEAVKAWGTELG